MLCFIGRLVGCCTSFRSQRLLIPKTSLSAHFSVARSSFHWDVTSLASKTDRPTCQSGRGAGTIFWPFSSQSIHAK